LVNDFEKTVFPKYPEIESIKEQLYDNGAVYASMSGSGSSVFGLFKDNLSIKNLFPGYFYWQGKFN
jgi:4-diphosphocytidyl-2-C-methyl-D-erythritol kinase